MAGRYSNQGSTRYREETNAFLMGFGGDFDAGRSRREPAVARTNIRSKPNEPAGLERLRNKLASQGLHSVHSLARLMKLIDENGDGEITEEELKFGMEDLGLRVNDAELRELFQYFDRDRSGAISYDELLRSLRGPFPRYRETLVRQAYDSLEKQYDGSVTLEDIEYCYNAEEHPSVIRGEKSAAEVLRDFLRQWSNLEVSSQVSYNEFLEYHKNLSAVVPDDRAFHDIMNGTWSLQLENTFEDSRNKSNDDIGAQTRRIQMEEPRRRPMETYDREIKNAKVSVPDWLKYDKMFFCVSLYFKDKVVFHGGSFDPKSRVYESSQKESFRIRTFVLKYFLYDHTLQVMETTKGAEASLFIGKSQISGFEPRDLVIGNTVTLRGTDMIIYDADKHARTYFKETFPTIRYPRQALPLPETPDDVEERGKLNFGYETQAPKPTVVTKLSPRQPRPQRNIDNIGKVLQFDCSWDDPSPYGVGKLLFKLMYHLEDNTVELREVSKRNSGRERMSLLNLRRQSLMNPVSGRPYQPSDFEIGNTFEVFGRRLHSDACDSFTRSYLYGDDAPREYSPSDRSRQRQYANANPVELKVTQLVASIKQTLEQRTNYGDAEDQKRMLTMHLKRHLPDPRRYPDGLSRDAFHQAMATFSCMGPDADALYSQLSADQYGRVSLSRFVTKVFDDFAPLDEGVPIPPSPSNGPDSVKLRGLKQSILKKLEVLTNFGDKQQQMQALRRHLMSCARPSRNLTRSQFNSAMVALNCWDKDTDALYTSIDTGNHGFVSFDQCIDAIFTAYRSR